MNYGLWGRTKPEPGEFYEKAYRRQTLADWDTKWLELSVQARYFFLNEVKGPAKSQPAQSTAPSVATDKFPLHILNELTAAGFIEVRRAKSRGFTDRVVACNGLYDFMARGRLLSRLHLLDVDQPSELFKYVDQTFYIGQIIEVLSNILRKVGIADHWELEELLDDYVINHRWPEWVVRALKEPLAERILDVVRRPKGRCR
jgi:hypothetical protein